MSNEYRKKIKERMKPKSVSKIVMDFFPIITKPLSYASRFYAYYYLNHLSNSGVKNIEGMDLQLSRISSDLALAFRSYGLYAIAHELTNLAGQFAVAEAGHYTDLADLGPESKDSWVSERVREKPYDGNVEYLKRVVRVMSSDVADAISREMPGNQSGTANDIEWFMRAFEMGEIPQYCERLTRLRAEVSAEEERAMDELRKLKIITNQREFTKACVWLFSWEERWKAHYGGKAWERISQTLLGYGTTSNVLFVDRCWGMQHNVAIWLDKVQIPHSRQKELAKTVNEVDKEVGLTAPERDFIPTQLIWKNYLPAILDANAEGNHRFVWLWAKEFDPQLEKYKQKFED